MVLIAMIFCALAAFVIATWLSERGKFGLPLTLLSLSGAAFVIFYYGTKGTLGVEPVTAWSIALIFALPMTLGFGGGMLLGWMIRKRRDRGTS